MCMSMGRNYFSENEWKKKKERLFSDMSIVLLSRTPKSFSYIAYRRMIPIYYEATFKFIYYKDEYLL